MYGYSLVFSNDIGGIIGDLSKIFLANVNTNSINGTIPEYVFVAFQLTFAAITVALISGSYIERIKFSSWILFSIIWVSIVYIPIAHWVWGGGFLAKHGALDFAGGTVVHINAGIAGLVGAILLGRRKDISLIPHNLPMVIIGTGLLWFGWFGFNAGSALASNGLAGIAFLNTNTATAIAALCWIIIEWFHTKKITVLGLASGAVAGLVAITPAAGFVNVLGSIAIGIIAGIVAYVFVSFVKRKFKYDDALDVFGIHGSAGITGAILTGVFADPSINPAGTGLLYGNFNQIFVQIEAVLVTIIYDAFATFIILMIIKALIGLRVSQDDEIIGLDESQHSEKAYNL